MMENQQLISEALQDRQEKILEKLYSAYWKRLYIYAFSFTEDDQVAQDLVQEIFISLWEKSETTQIKHIEAYLFRGVKYQAINYLKKQQRRVSAEEYLETLGYKNGVKEHMDYLESRELFIKIMDKLPKRCRRVFYLSRVQGYNNKDIALEMDISIRTVETHISNALNHFRLHFKDCLLMVLLILS
ncbi:RNA polymerase sigma factor [Maribacter litoralis]|uniref:RNA polymerase sigma factor n=1 Tax=Maribacter litoralis TaxID=2059726 RepID=UPI003F5CD6C2